MGESFRLSQKPIIDTAIGNSDPEKIREPSLRVQRSNPETTDKDWIASSQ
jgi:hypothetical protein